MKGDARSVVPGKAKPTPRQLSFSYVRQHETLPTYFSVSHKDADHPVEIVVAISDDRALPPK
jgi:hypothetical protein